MVPVPFCLLHLYELGLVTLPGILIDSLLELARAKCCCNCQAAVPEKKTKNETKQTPNVN